MTDRTLAADLRNATGQILAYAGETIRLVDYPNPHVAMFDILPPYSPVRTNHPWGSIMVPKLDLEKVGFMPELSTAPLNSCPPRILNPIVTPAMRS